MKDSDLLMDPEYMLFVDVIHREHQRGMDVFKYLSYLLVSLYDTIDKPYKQAMVRSQTSFHVVRRGVRFHQIICGSQPRNASPGNPLLPRDVRS